MSKYTKALSKVYTSPGSLFRTFAAETGNARSLAVSDVLRCAERDRSVTNKQADKNRLQWLSRCAGMQTSRAVPARIMDVTLVTYNAYTDTQKLDLLFYCIQQMTASWYSRREHLLHWYLFLRRSITSPIAANESHEWNAETNKILPIKINIREAFFQSKRKRSSFVASTEELLLVSSLLTGSHSSQLTGSHSSLLTGSHSSQLTGSHFAESLCSGCP